jgi:hypothetical protein
VSPQLSGFVEPDACECACRAEAYSNGATGIVLCDYMAFSKDASHLRRALKFQATGYKRPSDARAVARARLEVGL